MGAGRTIPQHVMFMGTGEMVRDAVFEGVVTLEDFDARTAGYFHFTVRPRLARVGA